MSYDDALRPQQEYVGRAADETDFAVRSLALLLAKHREPRLDTLPLPAEEHSARMFFVELMEHGGWVPPAEPVRPDLHDATGNRYRDLGDGRVQLYPEVTEFEPRDRAARERLIGPLAAPVCSCPEPGCPSVWRRSGAPRSGADYR